MLLLDGYDPSDDNRRVVVETVEELDTGRHEVDLLSVHDFNAVMSAAERTAYHSEQPVISDDVRDSAERLQAAQALLFCYPTVAFNVPATLKGWLERVMVPGVAFVFDDKHRVRPGMQNIRRIGAITTSTHGPADPAAGPRRRQAHHGPDAAPQRPQALPHHLRVGALAPRRRRHRPDPPGPAPAGRSPSPGGPERPDRPGGGTGAGNGGACAVRARP